MGWKRVRSIGRDLAPALLLTLVLVVGSRATGRGQVTTQVSNSYIGAIVGVSGTAPNVTPNVNLAGRFGVVQIGTTTSTLMQLAASIRKQSYVTVRIDGGPPVAGNDANNQTKPGWDLIFGDVGSNALDATTSNQKTDQSAWIQVPTAVGNNQIVAKWQTLPGGNATVPIPPIEVDLTLTLVYDMVSYQFTVINNDTSGHTVGLRFAQDYEVPGAVDSPVFTPTVGNIITEADLGPGLVPSFWRATNASTGDSVGAQLTWAGNQGTQGSPPFRLTFGNNGHALANLWDFTATQGQTLVDGSDGVYYFEAQYAPSQSRTVQTTFGKMHATIDFAYPMAVGVDGPITLSYDPTKPVGQQLTPNPFTVKGIAHNLTAITLTNVTATISLPTGLTLAPGETITKTASSLAPGSETELSWQVVPTGTASGTLTYSVSFSASPGTIGKSVTRDISIPALPTETFPGRPKWNLVSFPYTFDDPTPSVALGLGALTNFSLIHWNQQTNQWETPTQIIPGVGYFLAIDSNTTVNLVGAHPVSSSADWEISLQVGWNQIGNPWLLPVNWSDVKVVSTDAGGIDPYTPVSIQTASDALHRWVQPTLFWWDPNANTGPGAYVWSGDFGTQLVPFKGYFMRALKPGLSLLIPKPSGTRAAARNTSGRAAAVTGSSWRVQLSASSSRGGDSQNYIGMQAGAADGDETFSVQKPPSVSGAVSLALVRSGAGGRAAAYAQDIRPFGGRREWTAVVDSGAANSDVTLTWPDIRNLPRTYELYIVDPSSGQRIMMRQASSLRVRTGDSGITRVTVIAEPRTASGIFRILNWNATQPRAAGTVAISVTATQDASFTVRVLNGAGKTLRTLGNRASTGRAVSLMWDGKDSKGIAVPSGIYIIEVRGTTPDGQSASVPIPHVITR